MPSFPTLREPLSNGRVRVRLAAERDIPEVLIAYQDDRELHLLMGEERPPTGAELGRRAENAQADRLAGRALTLTIVDPDDDSCRGQIYVQQPDWEQGCAGLGIWLAPDHRGRGLGSRALALVAKWLLRECGFERVQILTSSDNQAMVGAAQGAGMRFEGVLRRYMRGRRGRIDAASLSMVRRDLRT